MSKKNDISDCPDLSGLGNDDYDLPKNIDVADDKSEDTENELDDSMFNDSSETFTPKKESNAKNKRYKRYDSCDSCKWYQRRTPQNSGSWILFWGFVFLLFVLAITLELHEYVGRYEVLFTAYEGLQSSYEEVLHHEDVKYWFELLRNNNKSEIVIGSTFIYDTDDDWKRATMFGDGRIKGRISGVHLRFSDIDC